MQNNDKNFGEKQSKNNFYGNIESNENNRGEARVKDAESPALTGSGTAAHASARGNLILNIIRVLIVVLIVGAAVWYFASGREFSIDAILSYTPSNHFLAAGFLIALYAVKSIAFFLPLMAIQVAVGLYFPTLAALLVNFIGISVEIMIPYLLGRKLGFGSADKLFAKFPKMRDLLSGKSGRWYVAYILRAVNMLPFDLVSMYLGSVKYPVGVYFTGSLVGATFGVLAATFIGRTLTDPTSPAFIISCVASCLIAAGSFILFKYVSKKKIS